MILVDTSVLIHFFKNEDKDFDEITKIVPLKIYERGLTVVTADKINMAPITRNEKILSLRYAF
jgi:predicted nucleic acid-binding protein